MHRLWNYGHRHGQFHCPSAIAVVERHRLGTARAQQQASLLALFTTIMIGRLDDYLREVAADTAPGSVKRISARPAWR